MIEINEGDEVNDGNEKNERDIGEWRWWSEWWKWKKCKENEIDYEKWLNSIGFVVGFSSRMPKC